MFADYSNNYPREVYLPSQSKQKYVDPSKAKEVSMEKDDVDEKLKKIKRKKKPS
jgi:hypothetical protein